MPRGVYIRTKAHRKAIKIAAKKRKKPSVESEALRIQKVKLALQREDVRQKLSDSSKRYWQDPKARRIQSQRSKDMWKDKDKRIKIIKALSIALMGNKNCLGHKHTKESIKKMSENSKGRILTKEHRLKLSLAKLGKKRKPITEETRQKMSSARKRHYRSEEGKVTKLKSSKALKLYNANNPQRVNPFLGKKHTEEAKQKNREAHLREKSWSWKGGVSFLPYSDDWRYISEAIKRRDKYTCQHCNIVIRKKIGNKQTVFLVTHHIDENKISNDYSNLITLCNKCHNTEHKRLKDKNKQRVA